VCVAGGSGFGGVVVLAETEATAAPPVFWLELAPLDPPPPHAVASVSAAIDGANIRNAVRARTRPALDRANPPTRRMPWLGLTARIVEVLAEGWRDCRGSGQPPPLIARSTSAPVMIPCVTPTQSLAAGSTSGACRSMPAAWTIWRVNCPWLVGSGKPATP
jgi:hypothetical protein